MIFSYEHIIFSCILFYNFIVQFILGMIRHVTTLDRGCIGVLVTPPRRTYHPPKTYLSHPQGVLVRPPKSILDHLWSKHKTCQPDFLYKKLYFWVQNTVFFLMIFDHKTEFSAKKTIFSVKKSVFGPKKWNFRPKTEFSVFRSKKTEFSAKNWNFSFKNRISGSI